jgi:predicted RNase H-like HicB family nuclease
MLVKFEIYPDGKFWCCRGIGVDIFTQGKTLDELMANIREAVELHFEEELSKGESIRILTISETEVGTVARAAGC